MSVFELEQCPLHINGVEIEKDFNGDQITLLVLSILTKTAKVRKKRQDIYSCCMYSGFYGNSHTS